MPDIIEPQAPARAPQPHLRLLPSFIGDTGHPKPRYILKGWLLTLLPSIALAAIVGSFMGDSSGPEFGEPGLTLVLLLVFFAPVIETLIMVPPLLLLNRLFGPTPAVALSAIGWGAAHSMQAPAWGLIIWWPFLIFSTILLVWRQKSLATGMLIVMCVHGLQNAVPALALFGTAGGLFAH